MFIHIIQQNAVKYLIIELNLSGVLVRRVSFASSLVQLAPATAAAAAPAHLVPKVVSSILILTLTPSYSYYCQHKLFRYIKAKPDSRSTTNTELQE